MKTSRNLTAVASIFMGIAHDSLTNTGLSNLLTNGFVMVGGCAYFSQLEHNASRWPHRDDLVEKECFVNKIHFDDYFDEDTPKQHIVIQAVAFCAIVSRKLEELGINARVIMAVNMENNESTMRFHIIRATEWLDSDLDSYENEHILCWPK